MGLTKLKKIPEYLKKIKKNLFCSLGCNGLTKHCRDETGGKGTNERLYTKCKQLADYNSRDFLNPVFLFHTNDILCHFICTFDVYSIVLNSTVHLNEFDTVLYKLREYLLTYLGMNKRLCLSRLTMDVASVGTSTELRLALLFGG